MSATNRHQISTMHTNKRKRPANGDAPKSHLSITISRRLLGGRYGYRPGLHRLWDHSQEIDLEKPVLQAGALDLDMVGELEAAFEIPLGNALVDQVALFLTAALLVAADR